MKPQMLRSLTLFLPLLALGVAHQGCDTESGEGSVRGVLDVPDCWSGQFDLAPDFFGAAPFQNSLSIRIQRGSDFAAYSDGMSILVDDVFKIRGEPGAPSKYGVPLPVGLSPEITPPGIPIVLTESPPNVHMTMYLQRSCRTRNVTLQAVTEVLLDPDGSCKRPTFSRCILPPADRAPLSEFPRGRSTATFTSLPNNKPDEPEASQRLVEGNFQVYLADVREACPGEPPPCRGSIRSDFRFYYQRGRPAQAFP
jgi:hypothetical protein